MGMLDRIKKRQYDGFKEFVLNLETSPPAVRQHIFLTGLLEDPIFMAYVMKNVCSFEDFFKLSSSDILALIKSQDQILGVLAKCAHGMKEDQIRAFESHIPSLFSKFKDELSYLTEVLPHEKEGAKNFLLKAIRKLQATEAIEGPRWHLPPQDIFVSKTFKDGEVEIYFESGVLAAQGEIQKNKRISSWKHYYETGTLLAEGEYSDNLKSGEWVFYFSNGKLRAKGKYKADLRQGQWQEWDRSGELSEFHYIEGVKQT